MTDPSPRFVHRIAVNLGYWQKRAAHLPDTAVLELDKEHAALLQAVKLGIALPSTRIAAATLTLLLYPLIDQRGHWRIWSVILEEFLARFDANEVSLRVDMLNRRGEFLRRNRKLEPALKSHQEAAALSERHTIGPALAEAHFNLSEDYRLMQSYEKAEDHGNESLAELIRIDSSPAKIAATLNTLGLIAQERGNFTLSEERLRKSVIYWRQTELSTQLARTLNNLAITMHRQEKYRIALNLHTEAGKLLESSSSEIDKIRTQLALGALYFRLEQLGKAEFIFREVEFSLKRLHGYTYYQAMTLQSLGNALLKQNNLNEAEETLNRSLTLWQLNNDEVMKANTLGTLGELWAKQERNAISKNAYKEAISLLCKYPDNAWAKELLTTFREEQRSLECAVEGLNDKKGTPSAQ